MEENTPREGLELWKNEEGHPRIIKSLPEQIQESIEKYGPPGPILRYEPATPSTIEFHIRSGYIICNVLFGSVWRTSSWRDDISVIEFLMQGMINKAHEWPEGRPFDN